MSQHLPEPPSPQQTNYCAAVCTALVAALLRSAIPVRSCCRRYFFAPVSRSGRPPFSPCSERPQASA